MPSSITLTVSHLPTSTSFFLSALQPLNYGYRGRAEQTVGFGPVDSPAPADFWITQETLGVPAGAAHVAFPATNRQAVQDFFHAALKAGATIYGEPCVRDAAGYYSAAVIDFDGNSIEAVYRPGLGEEDKENCAVSTVSKRSSSKAPSTVSRALSSASKARSVVPSTVSKPRSVVHSTASKARSHATSAAPEPEPEPKPAAPEGDALAVLLNQARSTADVARKLVEQVRPHLPATSSEPAPSTNKGVIHNPDAFAKPGDGSNAVLGTLLGVAAGAALTYALKSHSESRKGSHSNSDEGHDHGHDRDGRPSVAGRSSSEPWSRHPHYAQPTTVYRALDAAPSHHHINMFDNDYASTIKPRRRNSVDSGIGISPPSSTSRSGAKSKSMKLLNAPPTSYKAPTVITQAPTSHSRSRSKTRGGDTDSAAGRSSSRRSRSESRSRYSSSSHRHSKHGNGTSESGGSGHDYETVLHVQTQRAYGPVPASQKWGEHKHLPLPNESVSTTKTKSHAANRSTTSSSTPKEEKKRSSSRGAGSAATTAKPPTAAGYPLPPSRAATWAAGGPRSSSNSKAESFVSALSGGGRGGGGRGEDEGAAKTVVGKMRDVARLKVREAEVRPEDSVSQVSSVRSGRR
ncbi:uncharacterized protein HMPREF1541_10517 [Cyphellophora europaea CBS 101466]|uniref:VOC domain-containing protein n=1 Tax=Cyphellophora europaea (strain CBS 101466) TaxID=1220924 RepID=W2S6M7_CYPE1|nr:uncharacterized protein HMPREF1541_10517 [Cyphellophora europaea CBS 101466]ETN44337.1 hypothetical protein HMPREF1541_10517 [Cyphellophora europaea CBS 101466]